MTLTIESAVEEITALAGAISDLMQGRPHSAEHTRWRLRTTRFLEEVFGKDSMYYRSFVVLNWKFVGTMLLESRDLRNMLNPGERHDQMAYLDALDKSAGILLAAADELERAGIEGVYKGKDTGPETSLILKIINLAEVKFRKVIREKPTKEKEIQERFETLLIGADIPYSRESDSIEYSSKTYKPDFTVVKAELAIELKLCPDAKREKDGTKYANLLFVIYDCGFIRDMDRFTSSFETTKAICVRVIKH